MKNSTYITWAKFNAAARYNLANSGILGCHLNDLPVKIDDLAINGPNEEGFGLLKEAVAEKYGVMAEQVVTAQGTSMANFLIMATLLERGDEVLVEQPVYEPLLSALSYLGAKIQRFQRRFEDGYQIDVNDLRSKITRHTRLIVITSPHNPSGVVVEWSDLQRIGELSAEYGIRVLVDEVYRDILFEDAPLSCVHLGAHFISTSSLTKSYGLNGLRCGWILCDRELAERARRMNDLLGVVGSMPSDILSVVAFRNLHLLEARTRSLIEPNIELVHQFIKESAELLDCVLPARSMILFPRLKKQYDSEELHEQLRQFETSIVPGKYFESPQHFRLGFAVKTEDVGMGLQNLSKALRMTN